jgi:Ca2+-binding EF-hand superfamily protein
MHAMGYTPVRSTVKYLCKQVDEDSSGTLNLEEFLELMEYNKKWDGFTREQVDILKRIFNRFKSDEGEIMAVQVRELLLSAGWKPSIRVIHEVILQVDVDGSHSLNFREFLRLTRLFREAYLERLKETFANALSKIKHDEDNEEQEKEEEGECKDERSRTFIPLKKIRSALSSAGYGYAKKELSDIISKTFASYEGEAELDQVDFDRFVDLCDACRIDLLRKSRQQAGFSDAEVLDYKLCFCRNDADRSGAIDRDEVLGLIKELGLELQTKEDQRQLISLIQDARRAAADADVPEAERGKLSSPPLPVQFPVFLHLCRLLFRQRANRHLEKENEEGLTLAFTEGEVASLRALFSHWVMFHSLDESGDPKKVERVLSTLPLSGLRKLVRDIVQDVSDETLENLEEQVEKAKSELAGERPELAIQGSQLNFVVFLHVLRRMLNYGFFNRKQWPQLCGSK